MKFEILLDEYSPEIPVRIGNVYPCKGGRGMSLGHMQILFAITENSTSSICLFIVVDREGNPINVNRYGLNYTRDLIPIGFVAGLENLTFEITSI